jgi:predicted GNAT family acetyltransferase
MIYGHKVWVYEAVGEIASICALGRDTPKVVAITKVFTTSRWRRHGFAEHLVRHVTQWCELKYISQCPCLTVGTYRLLASGKDSVVLYAAYACGGLHVYNNVGFVGLIDQDKPEGVEDVLELGFVGTDRGHW